MDAGRFPSDAIVPADPRPADAHERRLADFTTPRASLGLVALAVPIGGAVALLALGLLDLIGLITHLAYAGRIGTAVTRPDATSRASTRSIPCTRCSSAT